MSSLVLILRRFSLVHCLKKTKNATPLVQVALPVGVDERIHPV